MTTARMSLLTGRGSNPYPTCYSGQLLLAAFVTRRAALKHRSVVSDSSVPWSVRDPEQRKAEQKLEWLESGERGDIERRFSIGKRCRSLGFIMAKLQETSETTIHPSVLVFLDLQKRFRLLLPFFGNCFLWVFSRPFLSIWPICSMNIESPLPYPLPFLVYRLYIQVIVRQDDIGVRAGC